MYRLDVVPINIYITLIPFCSACITGSYKDTISNSSSCTQCPLYSNTTESASTSLSDCVCSFSMGDAELNQCYGKYIQYMLNCVV